MTWNDRLDVYLFDPEFRRSTLKVLHEAIEATEQACVHVGVPAWTSASKHTCKKQQRQNYKLSQNFRPFVGVPAFSSHRA